jgi:hypothetical protein
MRIGRISLLLALLLTQYPGSAQACSCGKQTVEEAAAVAPYIFLGKVVELKVVATENGVDSIEALIVPQEVFKGSVGRTVTFVTDNGCCYCSYGFEIAATYLLYASEQDGAFHTNACSRSALLGAAEEDLRVLRRGQEQ